MMVINHMELKTSSNCKFHTIENLLYANHWVHEKVIPTDIALICIRSQMTCAWLGT